MIQRVLKDYIHATSSVDHYPSYPVVCYLDSDDHRVIMRLDRVVGVILYEYDLSEAGMI